MANNNKFDIDYFLNLVNVLHIQDECDDEELLSPVDCLDNQPQGRKASVANGDTTYLDKIKTTETKNNKKINKLKIVISGEIIEIYKYKEINYKNNKRKRDLKNENKITKKDTLSNNNYFRCEQTINETKRRLKRLIYANMGQYETKDKFITLTFEEYLTREKAIKAFKKFNKRLRYKYKDYKHQYIVVIERGTHNTKRLHLHCLFFNLPYIDIYEFQSIWKYGHVNMKAIKKYNDIANYLLKYLTKSLKEQDIKKGQKFYITSMNLIKPTSVSLNTDQDILKYISVINDYKVIYQSTYDSPYVGEYDYTKIKINHHNNNS